MTGNTVSIVKIENFNKSNTFDDIKRYDKIMFLMQYLNEYEVGRFLFSHTCIGLHLTKISPAMVIIDIWDDDGYELTLLGNFRRWYLYYEIDKLRDKLIELEQNNDAN